MNIATELEKLEKEFNTELSSTALLVITHVTGCTDEEAVLKVRESLELSRSRGDI